MLPSATIVNEKALKDDPDLARRLLFVAVTRSRRNLFISYSGAAPHPYVTGLPSAVVTEVEPQFTGQHDSEDFF